jgi:ribosomal-protein-alanine N-acetyltransferase
MELKPFIEGTTVDLRPLSMKDIEGGYVNWLNDPEVCKYNSHHVYPYTREQAAAYIVGLEGNKNNLVLAIVQKDSGKHIGNISLQNIDHLSRNAEYAIILGEKEYWGKGIALEASLMILKHGFQALDLHRIYCGTSEKNTAMKNLALAMGMQEEGRRKEAIYKDGEFFDVIEYGILKKNFNAAKK